MKRCKRCGARMKRTGKWWISYKSLGFVLQYVCPRCSKVGTAQIQTLPTAIRAAALAKRDGSTPAKLYRLALRDKERG